MNIVMSVGLLCLFVMGGCKPKSDDSGPAKAVTAAELTDMAQAVPNEGSREGTGYKVFFLALHQDQRPAVGFKVDAWVAGKSEAVSKLTNERGLAEFSDLPFPGVMNKLNVILHYAAGKGDQNREISYPYLESDAYRLKDIQYIPNTATP